MDFPQAAEATSVGNFDPLTHPHTHTQHHKYGCNIGAPKTTDTLLRNTFSTRAEGLKSKITCWSCWME